MFGLYGMFFALLATALTALAFAGGFGLSVKCIRWFITAFYTRLLVS